MTRGTKMPRRGFAALYDNGQFASMEFGAANV